MADQLYPANFIVSISFALRIDRKVLKIQKDFCVVVICDISEKVLRLSS